MQVDTYTQVLYAVSPSAAGAQPHLSATDMGSNCQCNRKDKVLYSIPLSYVVTKSHSNGSVAHPIRNLWSMVFSNSRATLIGCSPSFHSTFATSILEVDTKTGFTTELVSINGTSVQGVAVISNIDEFFLLILTRKGHQLVKLSLNTHSHEAWRDPRFSHLVHLSWDSRKHTLLCILSKGSVISIH